MDQFLNNMRTIEKNSHDIVWWKPEQIARGEDIINDPTKGERPWIIPENTGQFLHDMILQRSSIRVLELGTSIGYSTLWIACALEKTGGRVSTVERSRNKIPVAKQNFVDMGYNDSIDVYEGEIFDYVKNLPRDMQFDMVFMDADRGHYHEYLPYLESHLTDDGIIIADNAENMQSRMQPFLQILAEKNWQYEILNVDNGILVAHKQA